jgi:hypothetical protein
MPGTVYVPQITNDKGIVPGAGITPAATFEVVNNGLMWLRVIGVTGAASLTITNQTMQDGNPGPNLVVPIGAGVTKVIGPFPRGLYNDKAGHIEVAIDTPVNISAIECYSMAGAA